MSTIDIREELYKICLKPDFEKKFNLLDGHRATIIVDGCECLVIPISKLKLTKQELGLLTFLNVSDIVGSYGYECNYYDFIVDGHFVTHQQQWRVLLPRTGPFRIQRVHTSKR